MQEILAAIMILAAVGYGSWRVYQAFRMAGDPCYGCAGCPLKAQKQAQLKKKDKCWHKK
jgi:cytochrome c-type biogenesis protein CcmH/NrfG